MTMIATEPEALVWIPADELLMRTPRVLEALVYAPGIVCAHCHQTLANGFVQNVGRWPQETRWIVTGSACVVVGFDSSPSPFRHALRRAQWYGALWPFDESNLPRPWRPTMRALALLLQVEPDNRFALGMFRILQGGRKLVGGQLEATWRLFNERGGVAGMKRRRDLICRLQFLRGLSLSYSHREWVEDVLRVARRFHNGQMISLSEQQVRKIYFLEQIHLEERIEHTRWLIEG